jgi:hypothetical protein
MLLTLALIALIVLVAVVLALKLSRGTEEPLRLNRDAGWRFNVKAVPPTGDTGVVTPTSIEFNGQKYSTPEEMPPGPGAAYKLAMKALLSDMNHDGVPDIVNLIGGAKLFKASMGQGPAADAVARVKELEKMRDSGVITDDEYESKRAEIIEQVKKL